MKAPVEAAGAVCWRLLDGVVHVLVIHRTRYGDVTLPKGKVESGEALPATAVREVREETGLTVTLGAPLGASVYALSSGREKRVRYWAAEVRDEAVRSSTFVPNGEVAALEWVTVKKARRYLSYERDVAIIDSFEESHETLGRTFALIVLRHGKATAPHEWSGPDATRPLTKRGVKEAAAAVPAITAYGPRRIVTSTAVRCVTTVAPLAASLGATPKKDYGLSQEAHELGEGTVRDIVGKRVRKLKSAVLCSHSPVIPEIMREVALATGTVPTPELRGASALPTAGFAVVHLSLAHPSCGVLPVETF